MDLVVNLPFAKKLRSQRKAGGRFLGLEGAQNTSGLESPDATGMAGGCAPHVAIPQAEDKLVSAVHKPQGLQEQVSDHRGEARRSTHARLSIPPSLIELINLAKIQRAVICLIQ